MVSKGLKRVLALLILIFIAITLILYNKTNVSRRESNLDYSSKLSRSNERQKRSSNLTQVFSMLKEFTRTFGNTTNSTDTVNRPFLPKKMSNNDYYPAVCNVTRVVGETTRDKHCSPVDKLVFLKTHKTASATLASIIQRFGYVRNLQFALPIDRQWFPLKLPFSRKMTKIGNKTKYKFLYNHARYNFKEMDALIPNSKHVTILRHPVSQLESVFSYWTLDKYMGIRKENSLNSFERFLQKPEFYVKQSRYQFMRQAHNGQGFDLGLDEKHFNSEKEISTKIAELEERMELVLIKEYFDESIILLAKALCWDLADMLYIIKVSRGGKKYTTTREISEKILQWNKADLILYNHFNQSLWRKIEEYGPDFYQDLEQFRKMRSCVEKECTTAIRGLKNRYVNPILRQGSAEICKQLTIQSVAEMTNIIRRRQENKGN